MKMVKTMATAASLGIMLISFATAALAISPRYSTYKCPDCGGNVRVDYSREYQHDETFPCNEHAHGEDVYAVYEIKETEQCDGCSYSSDYSYEQHVFKTCRGYD